MNDERAYHSQARIFASGRWTAPSPPGPEFFHQLYMFTEPAIASKYWPAHSLTLVPGIWAGRAGAVPVALTGLMGTLVFAIAARLYGTRAAVLTVLLWGASAYSLRYRVSYLSHATTGACWLVACWALLLWRDQPRKLLPVAVIGLALAWMACTRPLTAVALGTPFACVLASGWRDPVVRRHLAIGAVCAVLVLLLLPLWSFATLGTIRTTPYAEYARLYFPFDRIGLAYDASEPARPLTPAMQRYSDSLGAYFREHASSGTLAIARSRLVEAGLQLSVLWPLPLWLLCGAGLLLHLRDDAAVRFGVVSAASLGAVHLLFPHPDWWTAYYSEVFPVFYLGAALGIVRLMTLAGFGEEGRRARLGTAIFAGLLLVLTPFAWLSIRTAREARHYWGQQWRTAMQAFEEIPEPAAIVFVHHEADHDLASDIVFADPFWATAPRWIVYDQGESNAALVAAAPERVAYRYGCPSGRLERLGRVMAVTRSEP